jgi:LmbE family N-acetylglucosaminyl deacetylase
MTDPRHGPPGDSPFPSALVPGSARLAAISPHLDDAVLGCGDLLARHADAVVVTAFAGRPASYPELTSWDARAGFEPGADVVMARRREDEAALAILGARPLWLGFPDPQYGARPSQRDLLDALAQALDEVAPNVVAVPLGLFHDDHVLTADAAIDAMRRGPTRTWLAYADAIYRGVPGLVGDRLQLLTRMGLDLRPAEVSCQPASRHKRRAVGCYRTQVRALESSWDGGVSDAFEPERYWQIVVAAPSACRTGAGRDGCGG